MRFARQFAGLFALGALAACAAAPAPVEVTERVQTSAIVQSVDMKTRQVLLRGDDGSLEVLVAGPEVKNLAQLVPGDRVVATYQQSVAAQMAPAGASETTEAVSVAVAAAEGDKPGVVAGEEMRSIVTIIGYDAASKLVRFATPDGAENSVVVKKPELQAFAASLKPGDKVELAIATAVAIGVERVAD